MAKIDSQVLFLTTSPRTPEKMIPEIRLLVDNFRHSVWNRETQTRFMKILREEDFFNGKGEKDPAFSARDRITRAPKSLGFVRLFPTIEATPAGIKLIAASNPEEVFLRQLIKFQIPSPYHTLGKKAADFWIKPYLEMLRLVRVMGTLTFDELQIFGMQLTNWNDFEVVVEKINRFRANGVKFKGRYKAYKLATLEQELRSVYSSRIARGELKTRESADSSLAKFLKTQSSNMRDYADACFRYLRATGVVNVSYVGKSLSIVSERIQDVDFLLENVDRNPCFVEEKEKYVDYLGNDKIPVLLTDSRDCIVKRLHKDFGYSVQDIQLSTYELKNILCSYVESRKQNSLREQVAEIKSYKLYTDVQETFEQIVRGEIYDAPLMLEWNTWRAMTMLDGGNVMANLRFDDFGKPLSTAPGNTPDIVCDYGSYMLSVEVTMSFGQRQYEMEGESVSRHLGRLKKESKKPSYALFLAPTVNDATIAYFYALHRVNVSYYGGESVIVPLTIGTFQKMLESSYRADYTPQRENVETLFKRSTQIAHEANSEQEWYEKIREVAINWL